MYCWTGHQAFNFSCSKFSLTFFLYRISVFEIVRWFAGEGYSWSYSPFEQQELKIGDAAN